MNFFWGGRTGIVSITAWCWSKAFWLGLPSFYVTEKPGHFSRNVSSHIELSVWFVPEGVKLNISLKSGVAPLFFAIFVYPKGPGSLFSFGFYEGSVLSDWFLFFRTNLWSVFVIAKNNRMYLSKCKPNKPLHTGLTQPMDPEKKQFELYFPYWICNPEKFKV